MRYGHGPVNGNSVVERINNTCNRTGGLAGAVGWSRVRGTDDVFYWHRRRRKVSCLLSPYSGRDGGSRKNTRRVLAPRPGRSRPCHAAKLFVIPRVDSTPVRLKLKSVYFKRRVSSSFINETTADGIYGDIYAFYGRSFVNLYTFDATVRSAVVRGQKQSFNPSLLQVILLPNKLI